MPGAHSREVEPHPQLPETAFITMSRDLFAPGTLGYIHFPEALEGRYRPLLPPHSIDAGEKTDAYLAQQGITTDDQLARLRYTDVQSMPVQLQSHVSKAARHYAARLESRLAITPAGKLFGALVGDTQGPVAVEEEAQLAALCDRLLENLDEPQRSVIEDKFGFKDWQQKTTERVAKDHGVNRERIRQREARVLSILRHRLQRHEVGAQDEFNAFELHSLAQELGYTYRRDIPENLHASPRMLGLTPGSLEALGISGRAFLGDYDYPMRVRDFLEAQTYMPSRDQRAALNNLRDSLHKILGHNVTVHQQFGDLLPEISKPYSRTEVVRNMPIRDLPLGAHALGKLHDKGMNRLGSLLDPVHTEYGPKALPNEVRQEIGLVAAKLGFYLDEIVDTLDSPDPLPAAEQSQVE